MSIYVIMCVVVFIFILILNGIAIMNIAKGRWRWRWQVPVAVASASGGGGGKCSASSILAKYVHPRELINLDMLDVGSGDGRLTTLDSFEYHKILGVEPYAELCPMAKHFAANPAGTNLEFIHGMLEDVPTGRTFDIVRYGYSFHTLPTQDVAPAMRLLNKGGILFIMQPSMEPVGKASPKLNKDSPEFSPKIWDKFVKTIMRSNDYLMQVPGIIVEETPLGRVFVLRAALPTE
jgi:SAM-dependent methyltransferase